MEYAVRWAKKEWHKNNVIIMGDMNKSSPYFGPKNKTPFSMKKPMEYPGNEIDTTINRRLKALDHVIWDSEYADLYSARVLKFDVDFWRRPFGEIGRDAVDGNGLYSVKAFQKVGKAVGNKLYYDSMRDISDHWPIEAVFYAEPSSKFRFKKVVNKFRDEWGDFRKVKYFPVK